jgi:hypothetical protein
MSEWSIEHAWKAISARLTKQHGNTSSRNQFNDLPFTVFLDVNPSTPVFVAAFKPTFHSSYTMLLFT